MPLFVSKQAQESLERLGAALIKASEGLDAFCMSLREGFQLTAWRYKKVNPAIRYKLAGSPCGRNSKGKKRWILQMKTLEKKRERDKAKYIRAQWLLDNRHSGGPVILTPIQDFNAVKQKMWEISEPFTVHGEMIQMESPDLLSLTPTRPDLAIPGLASPQTLEALEKESKDE